MATPAQTIEGIVLSRVETGENHLRVSVFCGSEGLQVALLRKRGGKSSPLPDLFDQAELVFEKTQSTGLPFVRESRVLAKRRELAIRHDRFQAASDLALLYLHNGRHLLEPQPLFNLLEIALSVLCEGGHPQAVFFKALFLFAQNEGLPVKESWLPSLAKNDRSIARSVLGHSVGTESKVYDELFPLIESLRLWLNSETELRC
jgi:recombinational DNA repair protein (RecF pathway)